MGLKELDYSLYLVTDNTPSILGARNLVDVVREAVAGGVTFVQLRDKTSETSDLITTAIALREVCRPRNVPLIVNDRVDVALAAEADGVHLGQTDMSVLKARDIFTKLGRKAIIGVTVSSVQEAQQACTDGADYLGIGTVFATATKENSKAIIGTAGTQSILSHIEDLPKRPATVCIGGINATNCQRVLYQTTTPKRQLALSGIAVVSAIIASQTPRDAAAELLKLVHTPPPFVHGSGAPSPLTASHLISIVPKIVSRLAQMGPLCHNMTNLVVQNFAANVCICAGSSPIMSNNSAEAGDLAALGGSLVINMGTTTPDVRASHLVAVKAYNTVGGPVLLDPVGAGATQQRRDGTRALLAGGYFDAIKGNEGEIKTVAGVQGVKQKGVDSGASTMTSDEKVALVEKTAQRQRCVVIMTGIEDVLSDGYRTVIVRNGHQLLGQITGSGCTLGATIASFLAIERNDKLLAAVAGILMFEIAGEQAAARPEVRGPGTFVPAFLDELYLIRQASSSGDGKWATFAKIEVVR